MVSSFVETFIPQNFALPNSLIYYISHESCDALKKLLLTCKFFYLKYKIIPCELIGYCYVKKYWANCGYYEDKSYENLPRRLWLFNKLFDLVPLQVSQILPKIYYCDIKEFNISRGTYYFHDLKILFSSKKLRLVRSYANIIYSDGSVVSMETLFEALPYVDFIYYSAYATKGFTSESAQKLAVMNRSVKLKYFAIFYVPENFNLPAFLQFVKKNASNNTNFIIKFTPDIEKEIGKKLLSDFSSTFSDFINELEIQDKKVGMTLTYDTKRIVLP